jgi:hypothetical protein
VWCWLFLFYLFLFSNTYRSVITSLARSVRVYHSTDTPPCDTCGIAGEHSSMYCGYWCLRSYQPRVSRYHRHGWERSTQTDDAVTIRSTGERPLAAPTTRCSSILGRWLQLPTAFLVSTQRTAGPQHKCNPCCDTVSAGGHPRADYTYQRVELLSSHREGIDRRRHTWGATALRLADGWLLPPSHTSCLCCPSVHRLPPPVLCARLLGSMVIINHLVIISLSFRLCLPFRLFP